MTAPTMLGVSEASMSPAITAWLERRGLCVYTEVCVHYRCVDFVASSDEIIVAVEAKLRLGLKAVRQAMTNQVFAHESWIAVANAPRRSKYLSMCRQHGLGLYAVKADKILLPAEPHNRFPFPASVEECQRTLARYRPGGIGGVQAAPGNGPAQEVARLVAPYRAAGKSWRWIYDHVPNHYANYRSMAGVMMNYGPARAILDRGQKPPGDDE